ncbi:MAG: metallophosphoesterase [Eubacterium sp.]|nr:metallophosphoesterase [Eubacterium sp.]
MTNKEIKNIISKLQSTEISVKDIPEEVKNNIDIVRMERKLGVRKTDRKGFDIITNCFFVEESLFYKNKIFDMDSFSNRICFETFEEFYNFLEGDIYTNSCYKFYDFGRNQKFIKKNKIDIRQLQTSSSFITQTIDDFTIEISLEKLKQYDVAEKVKKQCLEWIKKFNACDSYTKLNKTVENYSKSKIAKNVDVIFFFFNYIFSDINNRSKFTAIMKYVSTGKYPSNDLIFALCSIYEPNEVLKNYNYSAGVKSTNSEYKRRLKEYVAKLNNNEITFNTYAYFDEKTHFYCEKTYCGWIVIQRFFETFEEFINYRKGNLSKCNLFKAIKLNIDFTQYKIDKSTILPLTNTTELSIITKKGYRPPNLFYVYKKWKNNNGCVVHREKFETCYFFDFVYFLKNDLSDTNLILCDGLENLDSSCDIDFTGAKLTSKLCNKFNVSFESFTLKQEDVLSFECTEQNEKTSLAAYNSARNLIERDAKVELSEINTTDIYAKRVCYITDIHLGHIIANSKCISKNDVMYVIWHVVDNIVSETESMLLIGGDVSTDFELFVIFVNLLRETFNERRIRTNVFFILGNHELWTFSGKSISEITEIYLIP